MWARRAMAKWLPSLLAPLRSGSGSHNTTCRHHRAEDLAWLHKCLTGNVSAMEDEDMEDIVSELVMQRVLDMFETLRKSAPPRFALEAKTSGLGGIAGDGLYVTSACVQPGEIVALYPGTVFFAEELHFFGGVNSIFQVEDTSHFIVRNADGILIDGLGKTLRLNSGSGALAPSDGGDIEHSTQTELLERIERLKELGARRKPATSALASAYAQAHKANHPPPGTPANVIPVPVDFDIAALDRKGLCDFLPTNFALEPTAGDALLCEHSICFVASRTIAAGEEVWLDYRTDPDSRPPGFVDAARGPYE